jgi:hypothetical protein
MTEDERWFRNAVIAFAIVEACVVIPLVIYIAMHR